MDPKTVTASELKARCAQVLDEVARTRTPVVVTRRGKPIVRLVPEQSEPLPSLFGCLKGSITILGDIMEPIDVEWEAMK